MKRILLVLWQLPQALLGAILLLFVRKKRVVIKEEIIYVTPLRVWGVSLYPFIFLHDAYSPQTFYHELGHCKQSTILGPLYLLLVGLPSFIRAATWRFDKSRKPADYYKGYPEAWADKLGGVTRS